MKILLDTCTFLWITTGSPQLSSTARRLFEDPNNEVYLSAISAWEMAIKSSLGKLLLPEARGPVRPVAQDGPSHRCATAR